MAHVFVTLPCIGLLPVCVWSNAPAGNIPATYPASINLSTSIGKRSGTSSTNIAVGQIKASHLMKSDSYKKLNRATGKCLDTAGSTSNSTVMKQYYSNTSTNQQWRFVTP